LSRVTLVLGLALLLVEASVAVALIASGGRTEDPWVTIALAVTAGSAFVVSGLVALTLRPENRTGLYLAATGYVWFLAALAESDHSWLFTIGFVLGNLAWVPFTALVLAYPAGRLETRLDRAIPVVTALVLVGPSLIAALLDPTPALSCDDCPESAIAIADVSDAGDVLDAVATGAGLVLIAIVVTVLVRRWRAATAALRRVLWPVAGAGLATLLSIGLVAVTEQLDAVVGERAPVLEQFVELNDAYHGELVRLAKSDALTRAIANVVALPFASPGALLASQAALTREQEVLVVAQHQHRAMLEAVGAGHGARAEEIAREHARLAMLNLELVLGSESALERLPGAPLLRRVV